MNENKTESISNLNRLKTSTFHINEFAFCGFSSSGKTTLLEKLIQKFQDYRIAVIKHDGHHFEMDKPGKDTYRFLKANAKSVLINDQEKYCLQSQHTLNPFSIKQYLMDYDFVLIEGNKDSKLPKMIIVDHELKILEHIKKNKIQNIIGFIVPSNGLKSHVKDYGLPIFQRDEIDKISHFVINYFFPQAPLKAVILAGGKSSRMGRDKGQLNYHGQYQTHHLYKKLKQYVDEVYVSVRDEQTSQEHVKDLPLLIDQFPSQGPMSAILTAQHYDPNAAWLVIAIDLPFLDDETLKSLIKQRNPFKNATAYKNANKAWPEPLCTIWEPKSKLKLLQFWAIERYCPRKVLFNSQIQLLELHNRIALDNCNTNEDFLKAKTKCENLLAKGIQNAVN